MEFLTLYAELCLAWVAFTAIVATLRQSLGGHFTPLQYVMFRYFVESSLLFFMMTLVAIALLESLSDEQQVWRATILMFAVAIATYVPFHIRRRTRLGVPLPLISLLVTAGYVIIFIILVLALLEVWFQASLVLIAITCVYSIGGNSLIFLQFLGTFVEIENE
ncbi:MAG: hypothetical protein KJP19_09875 [Deltaproteobacteria bacterium]|nr:hypothetical protein [Deltaproteobacteria bacterium]